MTISSDLLPLKFKRASHIVTRRVAGELILVPVSPRINENSCLYTLDEVGAFLWEQLDGTRTGHDLIESLKLSYTVDSVRAEADIRHFLEELQSIQALSVDETEKVAG